MCDLICDVITCCVEAAIWIKSTHLIKSRLKTRKERENMEIKDLYINLNLKYRLDTEFTAC